MPAVIRVDNWRWGKWLMVCLRRLTLSPNVSRITVLEYSSVSVKCRVRVCDDATGGSCRVTGSPTTAVSSILSHLVSTTPTVRATSPPFSVHQFYLITFAGRDFTKLNWCIWSLFNETIDFEFSLENSVGGGTFEPKKEGFKKCRPSHWTSFDQICT